jgi:hypothetical protein
MWDVRLSDKEEELKNIQLEKAQNESQLILKMTKLTKQLSEYMSNFKKARSMLKSKEEYNRELRAKTAQRDMQWKTAFRNKQREIRKLTYELQLTKRSMVSKFISSLTGADKKKKELFKIQTSDIERTTDIVN